MDKHKFEKKLKYIRIHIIEEWFKNELILTMDAILLSSRMNKKTIFLCALFALTTLPKLLCSPTNKACSFAKQDACVGTHDMSLDLQNQKKAENRARLLEFFELPKNIADLEVLPYFPNISDLGIELEDALNSKMSFNFIIPNSQRARGYMDICTKSDFPKDDFTKNTLLTPEEFIAILNAAFQKNNIKALKVSIIVPFAYVAEEEASVNHFTQEVKEPRSFEEITHVFQNYINYFKTMISGQLINAAPESAQNKVLVYVSGLAGPLCKFEKSADSNIDECYSTISDLIHLDSAYFTLTHSGALLSPYSALENISGEARSVNLYLIKHKKAFEKLISGTHEAIRFQDDQNRTIPPHYLEDDDLLQQVRSVATKRKNVALIFMFTSSSGQRDLEKKTCALIKMKEGLIWMNKHDASHRDYSVIPLRKDCRIERCQRILKLKHIKDGRRAVEWVSFFLSEENLELQEAIDLVQYNILPALAEILIT